MKDYLYITDPKTNIKYKINSSKGNHTLKKYIKELKQNAGMNFFKKKN